MSPEIFKAKGKDGLGDFAEYMSNRGYDVSMPEGDQDKLYAMFL